jgi:hypothetical protein
MRTPGALPMLLILAAVLAASGPSVPEAGKAGIPPGPDHPARAAAPVVSREPMSQVMAPGDTVVFSAEASEEDSPALELTYQWYLGSAPVPGASVAHLVIHGATARDAGSYTCLIGNSSGATRTQPALLEVRSTANPGRLVRISSHTFSGTGENHLIAGFVVGGGTSGGDLAVLIRASGPSLAGPDEPRALPDPVLRLRTPDGIVGFNRGWKGDPKIANLASALGASPWESASSHDAALVEDLPVGAYTAEVFGDEGDTGFASVEVFDATPPEQYRPTHPRLVNLSTRSPIGKGSNILTTGFDIGGSTSRTVLIRGAGPVLAASGISNPLPDPSLLLYRRNSDASNDLLESNSGWRGDPAIVGAAASAGAFGWGTRATGDAAILATLPPGSYFVLLSGATGDTGVALAEVFDVP